MNIFCGNLNGDVTEADLEEAFKKYGKVSSVNLIKDMFSGVSKGFGFVEMPSKTEAESAIKELNVTSMKGKPMTVNEARPPRNTKGRGRRF
ncbi:MAG: RNA-binding protein [Ignavibacteria bacterium GWB2_35_6b]|nr:MAG: RNA-binding protein [Ignavibacteria bacterium GWB2_35_6b]